MLIGFELGERNFRIEVKSSMKISIQCVVAVKKVLYVQDHSEDLIICIMYIERKFRPGNQPVLSNTQISWNP